MMNCNDAIVPAMFRRRPADVLLMSQRFLVILDLLADVILLLVQGFLLLFGDVSAVLGCHVFFFLADLVIFVVELGRLFTAHLAVGFFYVYSAVLAKQSAIDFGAAGMMGRCLANGDHGHEGKGRKYSLFHN
jgi:hypothetical protein